ncbi:MAG: AMP-binding protein [Acidobacteriota bacterium]
MIIHSPYPKLTIPELPLTVFMLQRWQEWGDKPALIDALSGRTLSYSQLVKYVQAVAAGLSQRGFSKGDVFAIYSPNIPEYAIAFHAIALLGGIVTTINPLYTVDELAYQLNDSGAKYLLTIPPIVERALQAASKSKVTEVFVFGEADGALPFAALLQGGKEVPEVQINPREDTVALMYSSGTSGLPKGVMLTHYNIVASLLAQEASYYSFTKDEIIVAVMPFFHIGGLVAVLESALSRGLTAVVISRFDLEQFLQAIQQYKVTVASLVPPIVLALAKHPVVQQYQLSSLKLIGSGAAPLADNVARACQQRLNCSVAQGYGLTESSGLTHGGVDILKKDRLGSIGHCLSNIECKVVDTTTRLALGANQQGEICIRGPHIMKGYLNRPEATAQAIDAEGWFYTGDIGYVDDDGCFYIVDRVKELIKYKGMQVAPAELEGVLLAHPAIADVAVVPVHDEEAGQIPKAFVVLKGETSIEEIIAFANGRLAPHKRVRQVEFIEKIPKSPAGKILRRVLIEHEQAKRA